VVVFWCIKGGYLGDMWWCMWAFLTCMRVGDLERKGSSVQEGWVDGRSGVGTTGGCEASGGSAQVGVWARWVG